jgi:L-lactate dehydrogenase complex protein LldF
MSKNAATFIAKSTIKAADLEHRRKINFNIGKYNAAVPKGKLQFTDMQWRAIENLDAYLELFERKITQNGAQVIWAETSDDALQSIAEICEATNCKTVVKSKSMVTEEIHLNAFLETKGIESIETDLGEYIQQLDGEPPYHIITPAMHKNKDDVAKLFHNKLGTPRNLTPEQLTLVARNNLRQKYIQAEEGNARLSCAFPKTHIVIVGIEKVLPSVNDLVLFWPLLSTYGTGQKVTVYNSVVTGPRKPTEKDGPDKMYVILLDNGRTNLLQDTKAREALYCIRCGACLNACPIYKNIGGHSYNTTYSGPIGKVITPHLKGIPQYKHLSNASSLCGSCTEVCPVRINLHELLLENRHTAVVNGHSSVGERMAWALWKQATLNRSILNAGNGKIKSLVINTVFKKWATHRTKLQFPTKSFNEQWREKEMAKIQQRNQ